MTNDDFVLLNAYCDGELSPRETIEMENRMAADPALRAMTERLGALSIGLRDVLATPPAPLALRTRLIAQFGDAAPAERRPRSPSWQAIAAVVMIGFLGGGVIGSGATYLGLGPGSDATLDAVLAGHLRGLAAPEPFDIASSNRHVVKPWFNGRTTIAPDAPDLADSGFPLAGGRIDIVGGKPAPTLVYRSDRHVISVTIAAGTAEGAPGERRRDGTTIDHWTTGDLTYWVVSDLNAKDLRRFIALFRAQVSS